MANRTRYAALLAPTIGQLMWLLVGGASARAGEHNAFVGQSSASYVSAQTAIAGLRYDVVSDRSEAGYRVREQLVRLNLPNDAIGSTRAIEGAVSFDAASRVLPGASRFTIDLASLRSDEPRRDNYVRRNTLETDRYPSAVFVPREIRGLPEPVPPSGSASLQVVGDLTIREVTRRVTWEAEASVEASEVSIRARTSFRFEDFGLRVPRVSVVLSVEETIRLEADLRLRRAAG